MNKMNTNCCPQGLVAQRIAQYEQYGQKTRQELNPPVKSQNSVSAESAASSSLVPHSKYAATTNKTDKESLLTLLSTDLIHNIFSFLSGNRLNDNFINSLNNVKIINTQMNINVFNYFTQEPNCFLFEARLILQPALKYEEIRFQLEAEPLSTSVNDSIKETIMNEANSLLNELFSKQTLQPEVIEAFELKFKTIANVYPLALHQAFRDVIFSKEGQLTENDKKLIVATNLLKYLKNDINTFSSENNVCILAASEGYNDVLKFIYINRPECLFVVNKNKAPITFAAVSENNLELLKFLDSCENKKVRDLLFLSTAGFDFFNITTFPPHLDLAEFCKWLSEFGNESVSSSTSVITSSTSEIESEHKYESEHDHTLTRREQNIDSEIESYSLVGEELAQEEINELELNNNSAIDEHPLVKKINTSKCLESNIAVLAIRGDHHDITRWIINHEDVRIRQLLQPRIATEKQSQKYDDICMNMYFSQHD